MNTAELPKSEVVESIARLGREAVNADNKVKILPLPGDDLRYLIVQHDGTVNEKQQRKVRNVTLQSIDSVWQYALDSEADNLGASISILFSSTGIRVEVHDVNNVLIQSGHMIFVLSPELLALYQMEEETYDAKRLIKYLICHLKDCYGDNVAQLISVLRNFKATTTFGSRTNISGTKESLGREIENDLISAAGDLPEVIKFSVPMYEPLFRDAEVDRFQIRCNVFVEHSTGQFEIKPVDADLLFARRAGLTCVRDFILTEIANLKGKTVIKLYDTV